MRVIIGSARSDERGQYSNGQKGDQRQSTSPDYAGEVSMQDFYVHSKGWYVLRPKDADVAQRIGQGMADACNNKNLGYSQSDRYGVITYGIHSDKPINCDCSTLVRAVIKAATGKDVGDFTTGNEVKVLEASGLFEPHFSYNSMTSLCRGDVIVTKTKGHTCIVVEGDSREVAQNDKRVQPVAGAQKFDRVVAGTYEVTTDLNMRLGPDKSYKVVKVLKAGTKVKNYGYFSIIGNNRWLLVVDNKDAVGYCSNKYLKKV